MFAQQDRSWALSFQQGQKIKFAVVARVFVRRGVLGVVGLTGGLGFRGFGFRA